MNASFRFVWYCYLGLALYQLVMCNVMCCAQGVSRFNHFVSSCCECFDTVFLTTYLHTLPSSQVNDYMVPILDRVQNVIIKIIGIVSLQAHCKHFNNGLFDRKQYEEIINLLSMWLDWIGLDRLRKCFLFNHSYNGFKWIEKNVPIDDINHRFNVKTV